MTHNAVQRRLDDYDQAWRIFDPEAIGALFTDNATHASHPYDQIEGAVREREAIVVVWLEHRNPAGSREAGYARCWWRKNGP